MSSAEPAAAAAGPNAENTPAPTVDPTPTTTASRRPSRRCNAGRGRSVVGVLLAVILVVAPPREVRHNLDLRVVGDLEHELAQPHLAVVRESNPLDTTAIRRAVVTLPPGPGLRGDSEDLLEQRHGR